jgi:hypothetical protein
MFGGFVWSLVPLTLSGFWQSAGATAMVLMAGAITGILAAFAVRVPLWNSGFSGIALIGVITLPTAALLFGIVHSLIQYGTFLMTGFSHRFSGVVSFDPLSSGIGCLMMPLQYPYVVGLLVPSAVITAYLLRSAIRKAAT